jgi:anti-sigma B factor antagonist
MDERAPPRRTGLTIEVDRADGVYDVALIGELTLDTFARFELAFETALGSDSERIRLDIERLEFIDSTGLQSVLRAKRRTDGGDRLRITRAQGQVENLLQLTALDLVLPFEDA